ncbi:MAG: AfsR/SARP family transcriptional regulator [Mycobacteriales bacterium]
MEEVEVLVLGSVAVRAGERVLAPSSPRNRALLGILALAGRAGRSRTDLAEALWPGESAARHRSSLPVSVHRLRGWLRETTGDAVRIESTPTGYALVGPVDADRFGRLVAAAEAVPESEPGERARLLAAALDLWRGEPLAGTTLGAEEDDEAGRLRESLATATLACGAALVRLGRAREAVDVLSPVAGQLPLDEAVQGGLIEALAAAGRQAEALERYERLRLRLADELGVDPSRELSDTLLRVLRQDLPGPPGRDAAEPGTAAEPPAWPAVVPAQLPPETAGFAGRSAQLAELDGLHGAAEGAGSVVISALDGLGGVGKTALALRWAHRLAGEYPDGQLYVDLRGYAHAESLRPLEALGRFLRAFGVPAERVPVDLDDAVGLYRSVLAGRRVLVLLDNARDADQVRPLLPGSPGCLVLVTSRDRLDGLVAREGARRLTLDVLNPGEARALLAGVLGEPRVAAEPAATAELAALCGHLPLALRITAAQLAATPDQPLAAQVALLRQDRWAELAVPGDPNASVRATFDLSYQRLHPADRRLFRLLGLAPGTDIGLPAATALAGTPAAETGRSLRRLAAAHLIRIEAGRYSLHDLVGEYARLRAEPADTDDVTRLARWYVATAEAAHLALYPHTDHVAPPDPAREPLAFATDEAALAWVESELTNLHAVATHAATRGPREIAWQLTHALSTVLHRRGHVDLWTNLGRTALAAATEAGDAAGAMIAHRVLANAARRRGDLEGSLEHNEESLAAARAADSPYGVAAALNGIATVHQMKGEVARAVDLFREVLEYSDAHRLTWVRDWASTNLGVSLYGLGRLGEAVACTRPLADRPRGHGMGMEQANVASYLHDMGRLEEARRYADESLEAARRLGARTIETNALEVLAEIQADSGDLDLARATAESARAVAVDAGHRWMEELATRTLGEICRRLGDLDTAESCFRRVIRLSRASGNGYTEANALVGLALTCQATGRVAEALEHATRALALASKRQYRLMEADALFALATIRLHAGEPEAAVRHAEAALARYRDGEAAIREARARQLLDRAREAVT